MLVNDLDMRITRQSDNTVYYPWKLDVENPSNAATTGDNSVDNVEKITISNPQEGYYTVSISHKGNIGSQNFSVVSSGLSESVLNPTVTLVYPNGGEAFVSDFIENIEWTNTDIENINIYFTSDNAVWENSCIKL